MTTTNILDVLFDKHLIASDIIDRIKYRKKMVEMNEATIKTPVSQEYRNNLKNQISRTNRVYIPLLEYGHQLIMNEIKQLSA